MAGRPPPPPPPSPTGIAVVETGGREPGGCPGEGPPPNPPPPSTLAAIFRCISADLGAERQAPGGAFHLPTTSTTPTPIRGLGWVYFLLGWKCSPYICH